MSNRRLQQFLEQAYGALVKDLLAAYPTLGREWSLDLKRLRRAVTQRGVKVFTHDLPAVGKHLDRCLDAGQYFAVGLPFTKRVSAAVRIPKFLRGLYLLVFDSTGLLREDYDVQAVFFLRQFFGMAKRMHVECPPDVTYREIRDFQEIDASLPDPPGFWEGEDLDERKFVDLCYDGVSDPVWMRRALEVLDIVGGILVSTLGSYRPEDWRFRHGPGAIADTTGPSNKYRWFGWSPLLERSFPLADYGYYSYQSWAESAESFRERATEPYSRLVAVPKTLKAPRLIACEPSEHQWCQQNIWHYIDSRVRCTWISGFVAFRDQTHNQVLCTLGSKDGSLATIDLSAASDRMTPDVVQRFFRVNPRLIEALRSTRTRECMIPKALVRGPDDIRVKLKKFSTMGSACTFPIQSLVFLGIALSAILSKRGVERVTTEAICRLLGEVSVFGDDIIVPTDCRDAVEKLLEFLYFKVNQSKTFSGRNFRESCGVDAFRGHNVTPCYLRKHLIRGAESVASQIAVYNNFHAKWLPNVCELLASTIPRRYRHWVNHRSAVLGLHTFSNATSFAEKRWNPALQRAEILVQGLKAVSTKVKPGDDSHLFQFFTERPSPYTNWESGYSERAACRMTRCWVPIEEILSQ